MKWHSVVQVISPYVFKIETPRGHGTGFLCLYDEGKDYVGIATAYHVIDDADEWLEPIRIRHHQSGKTVLFKEGERIIFGSRKNDSAVILVQSGVFDLPSDLVQLIPADKILKIGVDVGWLGFPAMEPNTLCFFSGTISAQQPNRDAYLIDGVAINGVSGGPVFDDGTILTDTPRIIGVVTAYLANRATGATLPGLAYAQDVSHFHETTSTLKSLYEAQKQKQKEQERAQSQPPLEPLDQVSEQPTPLSPESIPLDPNAAYNTQPDLVGKPKRRSRNSSL